VVDVNKAGRASDGSHLEKQADLRKHAEETMQVRLGSGVTASQVGWWVELFCESDARVVAEFLETVSVIDVTPLLPQIRARSLVMVSQESPLHHLDDMKTWVALISNGRLEVWPGNAYHLAAAEPDACAKRVLRHVGHN
jgi:hypothetical protein